MDKITKDFIREESEWDAYFDTDGIDGPEEDEAVAECGNCGATIRAYDEATGYVRWCGGMYNTMYLCRDCRKGMTLRDFATLFDIQFYEPEGQYEADEIVEKTSACCRRYNEKQREAFRNTITTAAQMVKGARS